MALHKPTGIDIHKPSINSDTLVSDTTDIIEVKTCSICLSPVGFAQPFQRPPYHLIMADKIFDYDIHKVVILDCTHVFHFSCIQVWFQQNSTCPLCRKISYQSFEIHCEPSDNHKEVVIDWLAAEQGTLQFLFGQLEKHFALQYWYTVFGQVVPNLLPREHNGF